MVERESRAALRGAALAEAQRVATRSRAECGALGNEWCECFASTAWCAKSAGECLWCWRQPSSGAGAGRWHR
jgi:hypothetical protein